MKIVRIPAWFIFVFLAAYTVGVYYVAQDAPVALPETNIPIRLYSNQAGDSLRATYKQAIGRANESITCLIYSLTDEEIISALRQKAEEGVKVFVVCDPLATQDAESKLGPSVTLVPKRQKGLMHNKLLSIDESEVWLGSCNFTRDSLDLHANIVMGIQSKELAKKIEEKAQGIASKASKKIEPIVLSSKEQTLAISFLPDDTKALSKVVNLLNSAKKSIKVAMFTFTHPELVEALVQADKRGVHVEVVMDNDSSRKTSLKAYQKLTREKINVFVSQRLGLLHEKMAIIDESCLIMGSANWTKAAFTQNSENLVILTSLSSEQNEKLNRFWKKTLAESTSN